MLSKGMSVVIMPFMVHDLRLREFELIIYAIIYGCSQDGICLYRGGLSYLSEWTNLSVEEVRHHLRSLIKKGLISVVEEECNGIKQYALRAVL